MSLRPVQIPDISGIYYALLQSGYEFFSVERPPELTAALSSFKGTADVPRFFSLARQDSGGEYPYWPRAYIMEAASLFPREEMCSIYVSALTEMIMSAPNISAQEKDSRMWEWLSDFPSALSEVTGSSGFHRYLEWERAWLAEQTERYTDDLRLLERLISRYSDVCGTDPPDMEICICPIKCIYASDCHSVGGSMLFTLGDMRADSVIHEYLHTVIHPLIEDITGYDLHREYPGLDTTYYLGRDEKGYRNAFEEYAVRSLTDMILRQNGLPDPEAFISRLLRSL